MGADGGGVPVGAPGLLDGVREGVLGLLREEDAGDAVGDGLERAAAPEGDDGAAAGLGLEGDDAVVLLAGKDEEAAAAVEVDDLLVGEAAEELDGRAGEAARPRSRLRRRS